MKFNFWNRKKGTIECKKAEDVIPEPEAETVTEADDYARKKKEHNDKLEEIASWVKERGIKDNEILNMTLDCKVREIENRHEFGRFSVFKSVKEIFQTLFFCNSAAGKEMDIHRIYMDTLEHFGMMEQMEADLPDFAKNVEAHYDESMCNERKETLGWNGNIPGFEAANIVIDEIKPNHTIQRSKEIMDKLNAKDKIIGFRAEIEKFKRDVAIKTEEINNLSDALLEKLNKYINDMNII